MGSKSWLAPHLGLLLCRCCTCPSSVPESWSTTLPGGARAWRGRVRARREPAPLLLEARPGLPAVFGAPGGARRGQALLLQASPAGRAKRPCRAPGGRAYALLRAAFQESGAPSHGSSSHCLVRAYALSASAALPSTPAMRLHGPSLYLPRSCHELLRREGAGAQPGLPLKAPRRALCKRPALRERRRPGSSTALRSGKNSSKPELLVLHRGNPVGAGTCVTQKDERGRSSFSPRRFWSDLACLESRAQQQASLGPRG